MTEATQPPQEPDDSFDTLPARRKSKRVVPSDRTKWLWIGGGVIGVVMLALTVFSLFGSDTSLTEDYYPVTPGRVRYYTATYYNPDGTIKEKVRFRMEYKQDGSEQYWAEDTPHRVHRDERRRVGSEVQSKVDYDSDGKDEWIPSLKLGAKPRTTWDFSFSNGRSLRWTYQEHTREFGKPCAVIVEEYFVGGKVKSSWRRWYAKGVGVVKVECWVRSGNEMTLQRGWVFDTTDAGTTSPAPDRTSPLKTKHNSEYDLGYQTGVSAGQAHVKSYTESDAAGKNQLRTTYLGIAARFDKEYRSVAQSYGENHAATQQKKGITDGYRQVLQDGGIR